MSLVEQTARNKKLTNLHCHQKTCPSPKNWAPHGHVGHLHQRKQYLNVVLKGIPPPSQAGWESVTDRHW